MKSRMVWSLPVSFLLVCGMIGCGAKPQPTLEVDGPGAGVEDPKAVVSEQDVEKEPKAAVEMAVAAQKECSQRLGLPIEITNSIGMKLKLIPAGEFMMGSAKSPQEIIRMFELSEFFAEYFAAEHPQHKIRITDTAPFRYPYYHTAEDTVDKVDFEQMGRLVRGLEKVIAELVCASARP